MLVAFGRFFLCHWAASWFSDGVMGFGFGWYYGLGRTAFTTLFFEIPPGPEAIFSLFGVRLNYDE